jgi:hypothetical protein
MTISIGNDCHYCFMAHATPRHATKALNFRHFLKTDGQSARRFSQNATEIERRVPAEACHPARASCRVLTRRGVGILLCHVLTFATRVFARLALEEA